MVCHRHFEKFGHRKNARRFDKATFAYGQIKWLLGSFSNIENTIIRKQCLGVKAFYPTGTQECCIQLSFNILYTNLCEVRYKC